MLGILCWQDWLNVDSQRNHEHNAYYVSIYIYYIYRHIYIYKMFIEAKKKQI